MKKSYSKNLFWLILLLLPVGIISLFFILNQRSSNTFITQLHDYFAVPMSSIFGSSLFSWYGDLWESIFGYKLILDANNSITYILCYYPLYIIVLHLFRFVTQLFCFLFEVCYVWLEKIGVSRDD